jgi:DNA-binding winged helix-turn-helix (wHTH) protein
MDSPILREATMTPSVLTAPPQDSVVTAAPAPARFHPEPALDASRNPATPTPYEIVFGSFRLHPAQFLLLDGDNPVRLGSRALEILAVLLERPGELVSKEELMGRVWPNLFVEPANLTVHMSALRRTLRDGRDGNRYIVNVPGRGYCFVAPAKRRYV